jgi:hypothetical protein
MADTSDREPLWLHMAAAYAQDHNRQQAYAAEIRAVADWIEARQIAEFAVVLTEVKDVLWWLRTEAERA